MLKYTNIHSKIQEITGQSVTQNAVFQLIQYYEKQINENIETINQVLNETNQHRKIQGLKPKKRINTQIIQEAIKIYKQTDANNLQENNGGTHQKKIEKKKLASEQPIFSMEVQ